MRNSLALILVVILIGSVVYADLITDKGSKPQDIYQLYKELVYVANNKNLSDANLTYNSAYIAIGSDTTAVCSGKFNPVTATNTISFTSGHASLAASKRCYFSVGVDASDNFYTKQSSIVDSDSLLTIPKFDEGIAMLGLIKVVTGSDGAFVPGTTALNAASNSVTFTDYYSLPLSLDIKLR